MIRTCKVSVGHHDKGIANISTQHPLLSLHSLTRGSHLIEGSQLRSDLNPCRSMLAVPSFLLFFHGAGNSFQEGLLQDLSRNWSEVDGPEVFLMFFSVLLEDRCDVCLTRGISSDQHNLQENRENIQTIISASSLSTRRSILSGFLNLCTSQCPTYLLTESSSSVVNASYPHTLTSRLWELEC